MIFKLEDLQTLELSAEGILANTSAEHECYLQHINVTEDQCPPYYDGLLCWGPAQQYTLAVQKCFSEFKGVQYDDTGKLYLYFF